MKAILVVFTIGAVAAAVSGLSIGQTPKSPVGTCPEKDGEYPVYLPDSTNCGTFYECSAGKPVEKQCMQGLCFDSQLNVCAFPPSLGKVVTRGKPVGECPANPATPTYLADSEDCNIFYECVPYDINGDQRPKQLHCPPDLCFNIDLQVCDFPINADN